VEGAAAAGQEQQPNVPCAAAAVPRGAAADPPAPQPPVRKVHVIFFVRPDNPTGAHTMTGEVDSGSLFHLINTMDAQALGLEIRPLAREYHLEAANGSPINVRGTAVCLVSFGSAPIYISMLVADQATRGCVLLSQQLLGRHGLTIYSNDHGHERLTIGNVPFVRPPHMDVWVPRTVEPAQLIPLLLGRDRGWEEEDLVIAHGEEPRDLYRPTPAPNMEHLFGRTEPLVPEQLELSPPVRVQG
jgi:hypothetical protein